ncbi:MAG: ABC transporter ATP-binding protein [Bacillota bacterium]
MLRVHNVSMHYGTKKALEGVTFEVERGRLVGLLGPNGAGKTTLIRILAGLVVPRTGEVHFGGATNLGYVPFGERCFYLRNTGLDNLLFFGALRALRPPRLHARVELLLHEFGLEGMAAKPVMTYSSGERQRLNLARALLTMPEILLCDEPTANLDVYNSEAVHNYLRGIAQKGTTVLISSHDLQEVERLCSEVIILHQGSVLTHESLDDLRRKYARPLVELRFSKSVDRSRLAAVFPDSVVMVTPTMATVLTELPLVTVANLAAQASEGFLTGAFNREATLDELFRLVIAAQEDGAA